MSALSDLQASVDANTAAATAVAAEVAALRAQGAGAATEADLVDLKAKVDAAVAVMTAA